MVQVSSTGCSGHAGPCSAAAARDADAQTTVRASFGLVPTLAAPPQAAVTAKGQVTFAPGTLTATNAAPATAGIAIDAGAAVTAPGLTVVGPPGMPPAAAILENNQRLAGFEHEDLFRSFFGMSKAMYRAQTHVEHIPCAGDCGGALRNAYARGVRTMWVTGPLRISGGVQLGTTDDPLALIVEGEMEAAGPFEFHGVLYAAQILWRSGTGSIDGAVVTEGNLRGQGNLTVTRNPEVLARLSRAMGSFATVAGSWRDF